MVKVPLTYGLYACIDDSDYSCITSQVHTWHACPGKQTFYARGLCLQTGRKVLMHRLIMGSPPSSFLVVDHIDGQGWNNTRDNLRWASHRLNAENRHTFNLCLQGVRHLPGKWQALDEQFQVWFGEFSSPLQAAIEHDKRACKEGFLDLLNFPSSYILSLIPAPLPQIRRYPDFPEK